MRLDATAFVLGGSHVMTAFARKGTGSLGHEDTGDNAK